MRLPRPYIPLSVRIQVIWRQMCLLTPHRLAIDSTKSDRFNLNMLLFAYFGDERAHLDHDPPLGAREKITHNGVIIGYKPDANDPEHLIYRTETLHRLKTNVRGEHGQHPDRVLIKKQRRRERGAKRMRHQRIASRANPWPKGRKFRARP